jgi:hypothetical protein
MRTLALLLAAALAAPCLAGTALAQRHSGITSPPTAPRRLTPRAPIAPDSGLTNNLGPIQFAAVNYGVPAPQSITRQLDSEDERTRASALSALGAPAQYVTHGRVPYPHSIQLELLPLGDSDALDAVLTIELDQHIVSALLVQHDGDWHRVATFIESTPFTDAATTPSNFAHTERAFTDRSRYQVVFRALAHQAGDSYAESEAIVRIHENKPTLTLSYLASQRLCREGHGRTSCELTERWLRTDDPDPQHMTLVIASGRQGQRDTRESNSHAAAPQLRNFYCQPLAFNDSTQHFEPTAPPEPCSADQL